MGLMWVFCGVFQIEIWSKVCLWSQLNGSTWGIGDHTSQGMIMMQLGLCSICGRWSIPWFIKHYSSDESMQSKDGRNMLQTSSVGVGRGRLTLQTKHNIIMNDNLHLHRSQINQRFVYIHDMTTMMTVHAWSSYYTILKIRQIGLYISLKRTFIISTDSPAFDEQPDNPHIVIVCIQRWKVGKRNRIETPSPRRKTVLIWSREGALHKQTKTI